MNFKVKLVVVGVVAALVLSNYATYWATSMVSQVAVLSQELVEAQGALTDGPTEVK